MLGLSHPPQVGWPTRPGAGRAARPPRPAPGRRDWAAATADSGALSLSIEAILGRVKDGLFRTGGRSTGGDAALIRMSRRPPRCTHPVCTAQLGGGGVPTASKHHLYYKLTTQAAHGLCCARKDMAATQRHNRRQRQRWQSELRSRARAWDWSPRDVSMYHLNPRKVAAFGRDVLLSDSA